MSKEAIDKALTYLEQFRVTEIISVKVTDEQVLTCIARQANGLVIEYIWTGNSWI